MDAVLSAGTTYILREVSDTFERFTREELDIRVLKAKLGRAHESTRAGSSHDPPTRSVEGEFKIQIKLES